MKELVYVFYGRGGYLSTAKTVFDGETQMRFLIKPHTYEMKLSDEVIRSSSCEEYRITVSNKGAVCFHDREDNVLAEVEETQTAFAEARFQWRQDLLTVNFGHMETVDNYPNCDGEYDRWDEVWRTERSVAYQTKEKRIEVK